MFKRIYIKLWNTITDWLTDESNDPGSHLSDYDRMRHEIRPADVVLVEGRSRVSEIIKIITLSSWSHAALYIGRLHDIEDHDLREYIQYLYHGDPGEPLLIEAMLGDGTIIAPLSKYKNFHVRICRPKGLSPADAEKVVRYSIGCVTLKYDIRQLLDLARFMFPYGILPRRWRSSLFEHNSGQPTQTVCSTMIAQAYHEVNFPILPLLIDKGKAKMSLQERNTKLFTPRDFDYSPYFEIVKYPLFSTDELAVYRKLTWIKSDTTQENEDTADDDLETPPEHKAQAREKGYSHSSWSLHVLIKSVFGKPSA
jgi:hypothetical protein